MHDLKVLKFKENDKPIDPRTQWTSSRMYIKQLHQDIPFQKKQKAKENI